MKKFIKLQINKKKRPSKPAIPSNKSDLEPQNGAEGHSPGRGSPGRGKAALGKRGLAGIAASKRHFQLLELMVAAFILLVCLAPTMRVFTNIFKGQQEIIRDYQKDHIAHRLHAKFTEELYKRNIPLENYKEKNHISLVDPDLIAHAKDYHFECSGVFYMQKVYISKDGSKPPEYLCCLEIHIVDQLAKNSHFSSDEESGTSIYKYMIYIDTKSEEEAENDQENQTEEEDKKSKDPEDPDDNDDDDDDGDDDDLFGDGDDDYDGEDDDDGEGEDDD